jgi:hypothetical protein
MRDSKVHPNARQSSILDQLPSTVETILARFDLNGKTTTFAACPMCHCTYPPTFLPGSTVPQYPTTCENHPYPDSDPCGSPLLEDSISDDGVPSSKPLKPYIVADFHDYLANLLSQKHLESVMDHRCDDLMASIRRNEQPPTLFPMFSMPNSYELSKVLKLANFSLIGLVTKGDIFLLSTWTFSPRKA